MVDKKKDKKKSLPRKKKGKKNKKKNSNKSLKGGYQDPTTTRNIKPTTKIPYRLSTSEEEIPDEKEGGYPGDPPDAEECCIM